MREDIDRELYIFEGTPEDDRGIIESAQLKKGRKAVEDGERVYVHYHREKFDCNDRCHELELPTELA